MKAIIHGSGGADTDGLTAISAHVLNGEIFYGADSDEPQRGTMTVNSLLSFNVAAYSGRRVLAKWQNPAAAPGKPYSGVYIRYSTSGYPGKAGGMQIYKGAGNNTASGAWSQQYLDMPNLNETYYFSIYPYVTCSAGELTGEVINAIVRTAGSSIATITNTKNYTIPEGYTMADIFCVGGGGAGGIQGLSNGENGGGGGGGGYTATSLNIGITAGQVLNCSVGSGALSGRGGTTSVLRSGSILCTADGGYSAAKYVGANGGSRGGNGATYYYSNGNGNPGTNGYSDGAEGQGRTTRAFGEPGGTLYSGGGGGGGVGAVHFGPYSGGAGGGGAGGSNGTSGGKGLDNTGGGGGGSGAGYRNSAPGGSGVILIRLK